MLLLLLLLRDCNPAPLQLDFMLGCMTVTPAHCNRLPSLGLSACSAADDHGSPRQRSGQRNTVQETKKYNFNILLMLLLLLLLLLLASGAAVVVLLLLSLSTWSPAVGSTVFAAAVSRIVSKHTAGTPQYTEDHSRKKLV